MIFGYSLVYGLSADLTLMYDSRWQAGHWIDTHVRAGARIEVYSTRRFLPRYLEGYTVDRLAFQGEHYLAELQERAPDYVIITEQEYRRNADESEADAFDRAVHADLNLEQLLAGDAGYQLQATFKYKLHDWFFPDMLFGQNPRILIFGVQE
jgi:hypothetical protein